MDLPISKLREEYADEIKVIESNLKDIANGDAPAELYEYSQKKLDQLAERFQDNEKLGAARYKLYEMQALLYYFQNKDTDALAFIKQAVEAKGASYKRAEHLITQLESGREVLSRIEHKGENVTLNNQRSDNYKGIIFFQRSPLVVAMLSFVTFNLYSVYWSYKHWRAIRLSTGERTYPILSAIFQLFTTYPLFKLIRNNSQHNGYMKFKKAGMIATVYLLLFFTLNSVWRVEPTTTADFVTFLFFMTLMSACLSSILAIVQRAANAHNLAVLGAQHEFKSVYVGEIIFTIFALGFGLLAMIGTYGSVGTVGMDSLSSSAQDAYQKMETLRSQHDECSGDLDSRRDSVDTYSDYAVNTFNAELEECEKKRVELNTSVEEYNRLAGFQ